MSKKKYLHIDKRNYRSIDRRFGAAVGAKYGSQPTGTVGYIAQQLGMRPFHLVQAFERSGIHGVTPNYIVTEEDVTCFQEFYNRLKDSETKALYENESSLKEKLVIVQEVNDRLISELAKRPRLMFELPPRRFEELVAKLLKDQGCDVQLTKQTRDGGYDLFGTMKSGITELTFLAECKRYSPDNKVGVEVIRGLYGVTEARRANLGLVITSSSFTADAVEEKMRIGPRIDLKEYSDLCDWLSGCNKDG